MGQFNLPKSNKTMPPKKVNAVLDAQSDAAIGMPTKVKKFDKDKDKDSRKRDFDKDKM